MSASRRSPSCSYRMLIACVDLRINRSQSVTCAPLTAPEFILNKKKPCNSYPRTRCIGRASSVFTCLYPRSINWLLFIKLLFSYRAFFDFLPHSMTLYRIVTRSISLTMTGSRSRFCGLMKTIQYHGLRFFIIKFCPVSGTAGFKCSGHELTTVTPLTHRYGKNQWSRSDQIYKAN